MKEETVVGEVTSWGDVMEEVAMVGKVVDGGANLGESSSKSHSSRRFKSE